MLKTTLAGKTYAFRDIKEVLAKANEEKTGDKLAGLAAETAQERVAAKVVLAAVTLHDLRENPAVPYEQDEVTRIIQDDVNEAVYRKIQNWTVKHGKVGGDTLDGWTTANISSAAVITLKSSGANANFNGNLKPFYKHSTIMVPSVPGYDKNGNVIGKTDTKDAAPIWAINTSTW